MRHIDKMLQHLARAMNRIAVLSSACFLPPLPPDLNIGFGPGWSKQLGGATFCREPPGGPAALRHAPNIKIGGKGGGRAVQYRCQCSAKVVQHFLDVRYPFYAKLWLRSRPATRARDPRARSAPASSGSDPPWRPARPRPAPATGAWRPAPATRSPRRWGGGGGGKRGASAGMGQRGGGKPGGPRPRLAPVAATRLASEVAAESPVTYRPSQCLTSDLPVTYQ